MTEDEFRALLKLEGRDLYVGEDKGFTGKLARQDKPRTSHTVMRVIQLHSDGKIDYLCGVSTIDAGRVNRITDIRKNLNPLFKATTPEVTMETREQLLERLIKKYYERTAEWTERERYRELYMNLE